MRLDESIKIFEDAAEDCLNNDIVVDAFFKLDKDDGKYKYENFIIESGSIGVVEIR